MTRIFRPPRLLPATIAMLVVVLAAKLTGLVRSAIDSGQPAAFITAAWAAGPDAPIPPDKPGAKPGDNAQPMKSQSGTENKSNTTDAPVVPTGPPPITESEKAVLLELRERRRELEEREATLASRESMLIAAEKKLSARVEELQNLQKRLESLDTSHQQQEDAAWQGLVKVYETMKPRDAAAIFNDLGMPVLLAVVGRMKEVKAAAVLAAMLPDKARDVTTQLAMARTRAAASVDSGGKPTVTPEPVKAPGSGT
jgi:flagellar motility protein MotE (MotC chaperone)